MQIFWISVWFSRKVFSVCFFFNFQKNRSEKLSMLEEKEKQFWNQHWIPRKVTRSDFKFSSYFFYIFFFVFSKICFFGHLTCNKKIRPENWKSLCVTLCGIQCRFQNCLFFLALIVFDSILLKVQKHILQERQIYIYIYIYIYTCMYWVLLGGFEAINASN